MSIKNTNISTKHPQKLSEILQEESFTEKFFTQQTIKKIWMDINGDIERLHTRAIFVKGGYPLNTELIVYVDSRSRVVDFTAQREIYIARLKEAGIEVVSLEFRLSKYTTKSNKIKDRKKPDSKRKKITPQEEKVIDQLCEKISPKLKQSVSQAIRASFLLKKS